MARDAENAKSSDAGAAVAAGGRAGEAARGASSGEDM